MSTTLAGMIAERFGDPVTLLGLGLAGLITAIFAFCVMPETFARHVRNE